MLGVMVLTGEVLKEDLGQYGPDLAGELALWRSPLEGGPWGPPVAAVPGPESQNKNAAAGNSHNCLSGSKKLDTEHWTNAAKISLALMIVSKKKKKKKRLKRGQEDGFCLPSAFWILCKYIQPEAPNSYLEF